MSYPICTVTGGTFWGLCSLLTEARSFDEVLELCARGHSQNVDMLVSDIYASEYEKMGIGFFMRIKYLLHVTHMPTPCIIHIDSAEGFLSQVWPEV